MKLKACNSVYCFTPDAVQETCRSGADSLVRVLTKVSSAASRSTVSSASGRPRPPNENDSPEANTRSSFTDLGSAPTGGAVVPIQEDKRSEEQEEEYVDALIAAMSEVRCHRPRST